MIQLQQEAWIMFKWMIINMIILIIISLLGSLGVWGFLQVVNPIKFLTVFSYVGAAICFVYCIGITWKHSKKV